jgi:hypothetical protein
LKVLINKKMSELKVITLLKQILDAMTYINKLSKPYNIQKNSIAILNPTISSSTKMRNLKLLTLASQGTLRFR